MPDHKILSWTEFWWFYTLGKNTFFCVLYDPFYDDSDHFCGVKKDLWLPTHIIWKSRLKSLFLRNILKCWLVKYIYFSIPKIDVLLDVLLNVLLISCFIKGKIRTLEHCFIWCQILFESWMDYICIQDSFIYSVGKKNDVIYCNPIY